MTQLSESIFLKIIIAGDGGVGKTTLLYRYIEDRFIMNTKMTLGVDFMVKEIEYAEEKTAQLQIWDFGGQEHFRHLLNRYALGAKGAILVFDLTRLSTLDSIEEWVKICRSYDPELPMIFLGAKNDLQEEIAVSDEYALEIKDVFNFADYIKTSSKTGENVSEAFETLTKKILKREGRL